MEGSAVLTHDDLAGANDLAAKPLHSQPLGVGVAPVPAGGGALLVCHLGLSLSSWTRQRPWPHRYRSPGPACTSGAAPPDTPNPPYFRPTSLSSFAPLP